MQITEQITLDQSGISRGQKCLEITDKEVLQIVSQHLAKLGIKVEGDLKINFINEGNNYEPEINSFTLQGNILEVSPEEKPVSFRDEFRALLKKHDVSININHQNVPDDHGWDNAFMQVTNVEGKVILKSDEFDKNLE